MNPVIRENSILTLCGLLAVALVSATGVHRHDGGDTDGASYVHSHGHYGSSHSHGHSDAPAGDGNDGSHHDLNGSHAASVPMLLPGTQRDVRRSTPIEFVGLQLQAWLSARPETPRLGPPDRPPRPPTDQDSLPQIRTIVLLT